MHSRLGALLALLLGLPLVALSGPAAAQTAHPAGAAVHDGRHGVHGHPRPTHGQAVAALHRARVALGVVPGTTTSPTAPPAPSAPVPDRDATLALRDLWSARSALTGADRAAADRLLARPQSPRAETSVRAAADARTVTAGYHYTDTQNFRLHWNNVAGNRNASTPAYIRQVRRVLGYVYRREVTDLHYRKPLTDRTPAAGHDVRRIDVYFRNLRPQGYYGYCEPVSDTPAAHVAAFCVLDNDYRNYGTAPLRALKVTAAHEFFHAVQYAYDALEDRWFMEGSAVWMEDVVYPNVDDYLQYVHPSRYACSPYDRTPHCGVASPIANPLTSWDFSGDFNVYGDFAFFKFFTAQLGGRWAVRKLWEAADGDNPGVYSLLAVDQVAAAHGLDPHALMATFGAWNTLPPGSYPERARYQPAGLWRSFRLGHGGATGVRTVQLGHLSSAPVWIRPAADLGRHTRLRVHVAVPAPDLGGAATVQVRYLDGTASLTQLRLDPSGQGTRFVPFDPRRVGSVVVVLTNTSTRMKDCSSTWMYRESCGGVGIDVGDYSVNARPA